MTSSYDHIPDFGLLYDSVPLYQTRPDVGFYVEAAKATRGPVLELGCGTGRVLLPTARAGCTITGVDASSAMLVRCRAALAAEPAAVQARVTLHQQDVHDFDVGTGYSLVIASFRVLRMCRRSRISCVCWSACIATSRLGGGSSSMSSIPTSPSSWAPMGRNTKRPRAVSYRRPRLSSRVPDRARPLAGADERQ